MLSTNPAGETFLEVKDGAGRLVLTIDGNGNASKIAYDTLVSGLLETAVTNPLGNVVRSRVDGANREQASVD